MGQTGKVHTPCFIFYLHSAHQLPGLSHLFGQQNIERPLKDRYIRCIVDLDANLFSTHPEDEPNLVAHSNRLRFIVCMGWEGSDRLRKCQYVQSDIGFKRVVGFYEFELGGWERDAHTCTCYVVSCAPS
jgi:hypothetical protein